MFQPAPWLSDLVLRPLPGLLRPLLTSPHPSRVVADPLLRIARRDAEISQGKTLLFPSVAAGF
ncbi:MAG: hypothetical protein ACREE5_09395, partial [Acetobacteraceae bacterium]